MQESFKGIFPALVTPFDSGDRVSHEALAALVEYNLKKGVQGFYVDGSTAEAFLLSHEERKEILRTVSQAAAGRCTLIAHVGAVSVREAAELARYAEKLGYDAVSSVAPFYYKFSFEEVRSYYFALADAVSVPVLLYNIPAYSGVNLTVDNISEFLRDSRFIGVKHTSTDYFALRQYKTAFPDKVIYNGYDETFLAGLVMGADGAIGSTFNFMAEKFLEIRRLFLANDTLAAVRLQ